MEIMDLVRVHSLVIEEREHPLGGNALLSVTRLSIPGGHLEQDEIPQWIVKELAGRHNEGSIPGKFGYRMTDTRRLIRMGADDAVQTIQLAIMVGVAKGIAGTFTVAFLQNLFSWLSDKVRPRQPLAEVGTLAHVIRTAKDIVLEDFNPKGELSVLESIQSEKGWKVVLLDEARSQYVAEQVEGIIPYTQVRREQTMTGP